MTELPRHTAFLLTMLAREGPLSRHELDVRFQGLGPAVADDMNEALRRLVAAGGVMQSEAPALYHAAPPRLVAQRGDSAAYLVVGHPGADGVLRLFGRVDGPDENGVRRFTPDPSIRNLEGRLRKFGIMMRGNRL